jgi:phosphoacetylglucosamine mutase
MSAALAKSVFDGGPAPAPPRKFAYGTAGFRSHADSMDVVMYRVGALAALRAAHTGKMIGVMVTASHNKGEDNGSKIVDPDGGMLDADWEKLATELANAGDLASLQAVMEQIPLSEGRTGFVVVGRDTRVSSPHLAGLVASGVAAAGGSVHDLGIVTTPQVHWTVLRANQQSPAAVPPLDGYFREHVTALKTLLETGSCPPTVISIDCANGVGANSVADMQVALNASSIPISLSGFNTEDIDFLNADCGAEFVQKSKVRRAGLAVAAESAAPAHACSNKGMQECRQCASVRFQTPSCLLCKALC